MPKRSNAFQELVAFIEQAAAPAGARVTISAELPEHEEDKVAREVDILIEHEVSGHPVRIAIECRDHKRPQDKTWIDGLAGKYRDLGIGNVIAVSNSGFTEDALKKARRIGIRALTVDEALDQDWEKAVLKFDVKFCMAVRELGGAVLHYAPDVEAPPSNEGTGDWIIQGMSGEEPKSVYDTAIRLYNEDAERLTDEKIDREHLINFAKPDDQDFDHSVVYRADGRFVIPDDGKPRPLQAIELRIKVGLRFVDGAHRRYRYEGSLVTIASAHFEGNDMGKLAILQPSQPLGKSLTLKFRFKPHVG